MKVICIGQAAYDITLPVTDYPIENKKIRISNHIECGGGSAANAAYLLSKWKMEVYFAGVIGNDIYGNKVLDEFKNIGINTKYLEVSDKNYTTNSYIISNNSNGKRTILTDRDTSIKMSNIDITDTFDVIYFDGYEGEFANRVIDNNPNALKIIDAGSMKENTVLLAKRCDYVVCSKDFAEEYTKKSVDYNDLKSLVDIYNILKQDFKNKIIITLEEKGSFVEENGYKIVPSIEVNSIDSTGAGDIYHGAFTYFISNKYNVLDSMRLANITAALSTEYLGSRYSILNKDEIIEKYELLRNKSS